MPLRFLLPGQASISSNIVRTNRIQNQEVPKEFLELQVSKLISFFRINLLLFEIYIMCYITEY